MKLTEIVIENLGPYTGINLLDFSVEYSDRRVVLIGGKNGAGKTTLFNAIKIGLYGCRAFGYESNNARYMEEILKVINITEKLNKNGTAKVKVTLLMDDGKYNFSYTFERIWKLTTKQPHEEFNVYRNGVALTETEKGDFENYILQLVPPDMFKFYFFDGERISDFVFNGVKNTDFKNAFLKLCGLDTMEHIHDNFERTSRIRIKDSADVADEYHGALLQHQELQTKIEKTLTSKQEIAYQLLIIDEDLAKIDAAFAKKGGISQKDWQAMQNQISKEEAKREVSRKWLKDIANNVLPFVILRSELLDLRRQIETEDRLQESMAIQEGLSTKRVSTRLEETFAAVGIEFAPDLSEKVVAVLKGLFVTQADIIPILFLSKQEQLDLISKINNLIAFDTTRVQSAVDSIASSLHRVKQIRKKMDASDVSNYDAYFKKKEVLLDNKSRLMQLSLDAERQMDTLHSKDAEIENIVKKSKQKYEEFLRAKSVNDISAKALLAFDDLQGRLYKKYISQVERNFADSFHALINKSDLIDGIKIDERLQVYPYKMKSFKRTELLRMFDQFGSNYVIEQLGAPAYDILQASLQSKEEVIELPVEVKQQLSAGEKQVFIMSLYQALSKLNKVAVPYIIDTPFARIDTEHRQNILRNFFMQLKGQVLILSTDEEIVGEYKNIIDGNVSDYYLLKHAGGSSTKILKNIYFGGHDDI